MALALSQAGATLALVARDTEKLKAVQEEVAGGGRKRQDFLSRRGTKKIRLIGCEMRSPRS